MQCHSTTNTLKKLQILCCCDVKGCKEWSTCIITSDQMLGLDLNHSKTIICFYSLFLDPLLRKCISSTHHHIIPVPLTYMEFVYSNLQSTRLFLLKSSIIFYKKIQIPFPPSRIKDKFLKFVISDSNFTVPVHIFRHRNYQYKGNMRRYWIQEALYMIHIE